MKKIQLTLLVLFFVFGAVAQDCATIPIHFPSYDAAMLFVRKADWKYKDEISIYKSSCLHMLNITAVTGIQEYLSLEQIGAMSTL
jgi:hypothetical protein